MGAVRTDVWIIDNVMAGKGVPPPYDGKSPQWLALPPRYKQLVLSCLDRVPSRRPSASTLLQQLTELEEVVDQSTNSEGMDGVS